VKINYKELLKWFLIALLLSAGIYYLFPSVSAADDSPYGEPLKYVPRIAQGDTVYLNETIDISGATGWAGPDGEFRVAYYGQYVDDPTPGELDPSYVLTLPGKAHSLSVASQYRYWFDPAIFGDKTGGYWYQFISNTSTMNGNEGSGNLRAFRVMWGKRPAANATVFKNVTYEAPVIELGTLLPEVKVADYLVARGDPLDLAGLGERFWVFGRIDGIYDYRKTTIPAANISRMEPGTYTIVVPRPGPNTIWEASYMRDYKGEWLVPGLYGKEPVLISGLQPLVVFTKFKEMLKGTDDNYDDYRLEIEEPTITLDSVDELNSTGMYDIRGYTNAAAGTLITVTLDEDKSYVKLIKFRTTSSPAVRSSPGNMSQWQVLMPIHYDELSGLSGNQQHTLTARSALGGIVYKDFWVATAPEGLQKAPASIKYTSDRNPFVPTPTPEIVKVTVTVQLPPEVHTITVHELETPSPSDWGGLVIGIGWIWLVYGVIAIAGLVLLIVALYFVWVWWRGRKVRVY
jgi:hypothetical protein